MNNILGLKNCYGCGVCAIICPKKIIEVSHNSDGFYEPRIENKDDCINCGLCLDVCAFCHEELSQNSNVIGSYAAWSKDPVVLHNATSGGVSYELGKMLLLDGYKVCAVMYDTKEQRAKHFIINNLEDLRLSVGSKYLQSYTIDGFKQINKKEKFFVTGTPCQIDSFRRYIKKLRIEDNFILLDFFCHGVPSMLLWKKMISEVEKVTGQISDVSWRNKDTEGKKEWDTLSLDKKEKIDWHRSYHLVINGEKGKYISNVSDKSLFYRFFLGDACLAKCCHKDCKYKYDQSSADIRIGDLWGERYRKNMEGVNAVITFTEKGESVFRKCCCEIIEHSIDIVAEGQIKHNPPMPILRNWVISKLKSNLSLEKIDKVYQLTVLPKRIVQKIKRVLK